MTLPAIIFALDEVVTQGAAVAKSAGSRASFLFSMSLTVVMCAALLAFIFWLRYRSLHPRPEPSTLREALDEPDFRAGSPPRAERPAKPWEKPADWWKS